jgi:ribosomal protein S18 acetylase RimI-like enzyme
MLKLRRLEPRNFAEACDLLARAFHADPLQSYIFPDPEQRAALSPAHFAPLVWYGHLAGEVWTTEGGVAVWWPPEHTALNPELLQQSGFNDLPETIGVDAFARFMTVLDYIEPFHHRDVPGPHWYAMVIGVDPSRQRQGVGSSLLQPILARAEAEGVPCYLETCQPNNVAFYQSHGFEVMEAGREPQSNLRYWTFCRQPRP